MVLETVPTKPGRGGLMINGADQVNNFKLFQKL